MPIHQSKQSSELEKKFQHLQEQVYGKNTAPKHQNNPKLKFSMDTSSHQSTNNSSNLAETAYLKRDLIKITVLSFLAFAAQILVYFGLRNNLIEIPYYTNLIP